MSNQPKDLITQKKRLAEKAVEDAKKQLQQAEHDLAKVKSVELNQPLELTVALPLVTWMRVAQHCFTQTAEGNNLGHAGNFIKEAIQDAGFNPYEDQY